MLSGFDSRIRRHMFCCWFSTLLREVFLRVLRLSPLLKTQRSIYSSCFDLISGVPIRASAQEELTLNYSLLCTHFIASNSERDSAQFCPQLRGFLRNSSMCFCKMLGEPLVYSKKIRLFVACSQSRMSRSQQGDVTCKSPVKQCNTSFKQGESSAEPKWKNSIQLFNMVDKGYHLSWPRSTGNRSKYT